MSKKTWALTIIAVVALLVGPIGAAVSHAWQGSTAEALNARNDIGVLKGIAKQNDEIIALLREQNRILTDLRRCSCADQ